MSVIVGIDPGTIKVGYGVIEHVNSKTSLVDLGVFKMKSTLSLDARLAMLFSDIERVVLRHSPDEIAYEDGYAGRLNYRTSLTIGMGRGIVAMVAGRYNKTAHRIAPTAAKKAATGNGAAKKYDVRRMVQAMFNLNALPDEDAADAVAVALAVKI